MDIEINKIILDIAGTRLENSKDDDILRYLLIFVYLEKKFDIKTIPSYRYILDESKQAPIPQTYMNNITVEFLTYLMYGYDGEIHKYVKNELLKKQYNDAFYENPNFFELIKDDEFKDVVLDLNKFQFSNMIYIQFSFAYDQLKQNEYNPDTDEEKSEKYVCNNTSTINGKLDLAGIICKAATYDWGHKEDDSFVYKLIYDNLRKEKICEITKKSIIKRMTKYIKLFKKGELDSNSSYYPYEYLLKKFSNFLNEQFQIHNNKLSIKRDFFNDNNVRPFEFMLALKDDDYIDIEDIVINENKYILKVCSIKPLPVEKKYNKQQKEGISPVKLPDNAVWAKLAIKFLDGHNVLIKYDNKEIGKRNYKEMGFENKKTNTPNVQWELLRELAENLGIMFRREKTKKLGVNTGLQDADSETKEGFTKFRISDKNKKRKDILSKQLQEYFQIEDKPFYEFKKEKSYRIKIELIPE